MGAGVPAHIGEVHAHKLHDGPRQDLPQNPEDASHVQMEKAQQGADKNQEGEQHKEKVKGQGGALDPHAVTEIPLGHEVRAPEKRAAGKLDLHGNTAFPISAADNG